LRARIAPIFGCDGRDLAVECRAPPGPSAVFAARRTPDPGRIVDEYLIVLAAGS
jgi:hypothetical protein